MPAVRLPWLEIKWKRPAPLLSDSAASQILCKRGRGKPISLDCLLQMPLSSFPVKLHQWQATLQERESKQGLLHWSAHWPIWIWTESPSQQKDTSKDIIMCLCMFSLDNVLLFLCKPLQDILINRMHVGGEGHDKMLLFRGLNALIQNIHIYSNLFWFLTCPFSKVHDTNLDWPCWSPLTSSLVHMFLHVQMIWKGSQVSTSHHWEILNSSKNIP